MGQVEHIGDCTLYCADWRDILPTLQAVDAVVTDPPYGVGIAYATYVDNVITPQLWLDALRSCTQGPIAVSCGIGNIHLWPRADWVFAWFRPNSMRRVLPGWNVWEPVLLYGKPYGKQTHDAFTVNIVPQKDTGTHPCPKPLGWACALIERLTQEQQIVLDSFMGSGTTGAACIKLQRRFVGIEIESQYFDEACRRIEEAYRQLALFPPPVVQRPLQEALF